MTLAGRAGSVGDATLGAAESRVGCLGLALGATGQKRDASLTGVAGGLRVRVWERVQVKVSASYRPGLRRGSLPSFFLQDKNRIV